MPGNTSTGLQGCVRGLSVGGRAVGLGGEEPLLREVVGLVACRAHPCSAGPCSNGAECGAVGEGEQGVLVLGARGARGRAQCDCAKGFRGSRCHKRVGRGRRGRRVGGRKRKGKKKKRRGPKMHSSNKKRKERRNRKYLT